MGITREEKIERFGYDPQEQLRLIGSATALHRGKLDKFDFYYSASLKRIDVCYSGYNSTHCRGSEISDTETTLPAEFTKAFFEVKSRVPQGYRFENKPWIGRIVASINEPPPDDKHLSGQSVHLDVYFDAESGSVDIHIVGRCCPMFRAVLHPSGSTTLPPELQEICTKLSQKPQLSIDEHNTSCDECAASIRLRGH